MAAGCGPVSGEFDPRRSPHPPRPGGTRKRTPKALARVRLAARRLRRCLVMRLASQLHCLWSEIGSIPLRGADGFAVKHQRSLQNSGRRSVTCRTRHGLEQKAALLPRTQGLPERYRPGPRARAKGRWSPRHGDHPGAIPGGSTVRRTGSQHEGRAPALQAVRWEFDPPRLHHAGLLEAGAAPGTGVETGALPVASSARRRLSGRTDPLYGPQASPNLAAGSDMRPWPSGKAAGFQPAIRGSESRRSLWVARSRRRESRATPAESREPVAAQPERPTFSRGSGGRAPHNLAKVDQTGSSPVIRSMLLAEQCR